MKVVSNITMKVTVVSTGLDQFSRSMTMRLQPLSTVRHASKSDKALYRYLIEITWLDWRRGLGSVTHFTHLGINWASTKIGRLCCSQDYTCYGCRSHLRMMLQV